MNSTIDLCISDMIDFLRLSIANKDVLSVVSQYRSSTVTDLFASVGVNTDSIGLIDCSMLERK
jgi:hypothetical protein